MKKTTLLAALVVFSTFVAAPASAAPSGLDGIRSGETSLIEQAQWRRCWWRDGARVCRWYRGWGYGPGWRWGWRRHHHW
jgi:hypothetical protein